MSKVHPIVAVTGSSGAGTTNVKTAMEHVLKREGLRAAFIEGDSFHRYDRQAMQIAVAAAQATGGSVTHFGPEGNLFASMEALLREYAEHGTGKRRYYVHTEDEAKVHGAAPGTFTDWQALPADTDLLFYEGLHGGLVCAEANILQHVDLLIGVVPTINLEWVQKIQRDRAVRGYSLEAATASILSRMHDYVHYIVPQFSQTDINFQRVPMVDTANPFALHDIPSNDESLCVVHVANRRKVPVDFRYLLEMLSGSFMSAPDTIVIPAGKKVFAMELIVGPIIARLVRESAWPSG